MLDMQLTSQLRALFNFRFYFTTRRILFEKGGIQSVNSSPGDQTFNQTSNPYDIPSYQSIRAEFGVEPTTDFRFTHGANHGLGNVFIYVSRYGPACTSQAWAIQARTLSFPMKGAKPIGEIWSLLSERTETKPASLTSLCQTRQAGSHLRGCHV